MAVSFWTLLQSSLLCIYMHKVLQLVITSTILSQYDHLFFSFVHIERTRAKPVVIPMINATAFVGESATLLCRAYSDAMPHFQWLRWFPMHFNSSGNSTEGSKFQYEVIKQNQQAPINWLSTSNSRHAFHEVTLILDNVTKKSEGKYTCLVRNSLGYALRNAYIIVHEKIGKWLPIIVIIKKKRSNKRNLIYLILPQQQFNARGTQLGRMNLVMNSYYSSFKERSNYVLFSSQCTFRRPRSLRWAPIRPEFRDTLLAKQGVKHNHLILKMSIKIYL